MPAVPERLPLQPVARQLLRLRVHLDAFRAAPRRWLTAAGWWLLRKRVRARGQFAPLLARSPSAYALWGLQGEAAWRRPSPPDPRLPIIALVTAGPGQAATCASLAAEHVPAIVIASHRDLAAAARQIDWPAQPWLMPVRAGDQLAPGAAARYRAAIAEGPASLFYADDDLIEAWQGRCDPHFKPDWNSELFRHHDYVTGAAIVRASRDDLARAAWQPDWAAALVSHAARTGPVRHIRHVLHHRAVRPAPPPLPPARCAAVLPPLSIIIPTRNRRDLLETCLAGVFAANYPDLETIIVDNDSDDPATLAWLAALPPSRVRVLHHAGAFNYSAINNRAVAAARGRLLCLLNNDVEMTDPDWLAIMATQALRDDVGAVGARLLYPDGRIQHAGVVIGVGNAAGHAHRFVHPHEDGYFRRHALPQFVSAVTAACLVVQRERYLAVGGLDETNFAVAYNDVDLCLRLNQRGWQSLYEPRATLIHHESVSRGHDRDPAGAARLAREQAALRRLWQTDSVVDPFHHPQLSRAAERFAVAL